MKPWSRIPLMTKVYLALLLCLGATLLILALLRLSGSAGETGFMRFPWRSRAGQGEETLLAAEGSSPSAVESAPFPQGTPWLRPITVAAIRTAPDAQTTPAAILDKNQVVQVVGASPDREWYAIAVPYFEGGMGWVAAAEVEAQSQENIPILESLTLPTIPLVPTDQLPYVQAIANVNVRQGPDLNTARIGLLSKEQTAELVGQSEDGYWWAIRFPEAKDGIGWISRDYVIARNARNVPVITPQNQPLQAIVATPAPGRPSLTAIWRVNIRAGPGTTYAIIGVLEQGESAEIIGMSTDGQWWAIRLEGVPEGRGWVAAAFVQAANATAVPVINP